MSRTYLDKKGSRTSTRHAFHSRKKRHHPLNRYLMENKETSTSTSAKKLKSSEDAEIEVDVSFSYRIINFLSVFSAISEVVKCKTCDGNIKFTEVSPRRLGFKLKLSCESCDPVCINSCPLISVRAYEVNRRIVFAFRLLGIGLADIEKFCGIMDMSKPTFQSFYDKVVNIHIAVKKICELSIKIAFEEEKKISVEKGDDKGHTILGDGTWRTRGFSSLLGVLTIIGYHTGKVINFVVKCRYILQGV